MEQQNKTVQDITKKRSDQAEQVVGEGIDTKDYLPKWADPGLRFTGPALQQLADQTTKTFAEESLVEGTTGAITLLGRMSAAHDAGIAAQGAARARVVQQRAAVAQQRAAVEEAFDTERRVDQLMLDIPLPPGVSYRPPLTPDVSPSLPVAAAPKPQTKAVVDVASQPKPDVSSTQPLPRRTLMQQVAAETRNPMDVPVGRPKNVTIGPKPGDGPSEIVRPTVSTTDKPVTKAPQSPSDSYQSGVGGPRLTLDESVLPVRPSNPATPSRPVAVATKPKAAATPSAPAKPRSNKQVATPKPVVASTPTKNKPIKYEGEDFDIPDSPEYQSRNSSAPLPPEPDYSRSFFDDPNPPVAPAPITNPPKSTAAKMYDKVKSLVTPKPNKPFKITDITNPEQLDMATTETVRRISQYASSPENAARMMETVPGLMKSKIKKVEIDPNLSVNSTRLGTYDVGGSYSTNSSGSTVGFRTKAPDSRAVIHELTHGFQDVTGQITPQAADKLLKDPSISGFINDPGGLSRLYADLKKEGVLKRTYTSAQINKEPRELLTTLMQFEDTASFANNPVAQGVLRRLVKAAGYQKGGIIYVSNGALIGAQNRGTDSVPAMLTPGEFVVNRNAAQQYMPILNAINSGHMSRGGIIKYLADGGIVRPKYLEQGSQVSGNIANMSSQSGVLTSTSQQAAQKPVTMEKPAWVDDFISRFNQGASTLADGASTIASGARDIKEANPTLTLGGNVNIGNSRQIVQESLAGMMPIAESVGNSAVSAANKNTQDQWNKKTDYA